MGTMIKSPSQNGRSYPHLLRPRIATGAACGIILFFVAAHLPAATPMASVEVSPTPITSAYQDAVFTVTLSEPTSRGIAIAFFMSGGARSGSDYVLFGNFDGRGHIVIPAGETSATV